LTIPSTRGSQTVRRDALVGRFNFTRASHKSKLSAVLFIELPTVKFSAVLSFYQSILLKCHHANSR